MKKLTALISILLCSLSLFAATIKVMSFNVNGVKNKINANERYARNISAIIKESGADIVLMQEFYTKRDENEPKLLCKTLGDSWWYFSARGYIASFSTEEHVCQQNNVIFYNNQKILPTSNKDSGIVNFRTDSKYKFTKNHTQLVEFCLSGEPSKTFLVVNVHLPVYTKNRDRQKLLEYLHDLKSLETLYSDLDKKSRRIIIGGDFNTKRAKSSGLDAGEILRYKYPNSKIERFSGAIVDSDNQLYCYQIGGLPTSGFDKNQSRISPTLDIDHFIVKNINVVKDTGLYLGSVHLENNNYNSPYIFKNISKDSKFERTMKYYKQHVSDHLPIIIELDL